MAKKTAKQTNRTATVKDYVTVAFAEDMDLARQYQQLLGDHEISAVVKRQPEMAQNGFSDIAILVPEPATVALLGLGALARMRRRTT